MNARRLIMVSLVTLCTAVAALGVGCVPAFGVLTHNLLFQISEVPAEGPLHEKVALPGPLPGRLLSLTVDSGHVWVAGQQETTRSFSVNRFSAETGAFISQFAAGGARAQLVLATPVL